VAFIDQYSLSDDVIFRRRVEQAALTSATSVSSETRADPPTAQQTRRANLAIKILLDPGTYAVLFAKAVASNVAITPQSADSDLLFTCNSLFDAFAGEV
jgi:hypothetical protein